MASKKIKQKLPQVNNQFAGSYVANLTGNNVNIPAAPLQIAANNQQAFGGNTYQSYLVGNKPTVNSVNGGMSNLFGTTDVNGTGGGGSSNNGSTAGNTGTTGSTGVTDGTGNDVVTGNTGTAGNTGNGTVTGNTGNKDETTTPETGNGTGTGDIPGTGESPITGETEGGEKKEQLVTQTYGGWLESLKEQEQSIVDQYNEDIDYATKVKEESYKKADDAYNIAMRDANANFRTNQPTYGAAAEQLLGSGLTGSGYSDYLGGKAYEARTGEINAARSQMSYAKQLADSQYEAAKNTAETNKISRQDALNQWKLNYSVQLDAEYKAKVEEVLQAVLSGDYDVESAKTVLQNYANGGEVSEDIINSIIAHHDTYALTEYINWISAQISAGQTPNALAAKAWLQNTKIGDAKTQEYLDLYFNADGSLKKTFKLNDIKVDVFSTYTSWMDEQIKAGKTPTVAVAKHYLETLGVDNASVQAYLNVYYDKNGNLLTKEEINNNIADAVNPENKPENDNNEAGESTDEKLSEAAKYLREAAEAAENGLSGAAAYNAFKTAMNKHDIGDYSSYKKLIDEMDRLVAEGKFEANVATEMKNMINGLVVGSGVFEENRGLRKKFQDGDNFTVKINNNGYSYKVQSGGQADDAVVAASKDLKDGVVFGYGSELYLKSGDTAYKIEARPVFGNEDYDKLWSAVYGEAIKNLSAQKGYVQENEGNKTYKGNKTDKGTYEEEDVADVPLKDPNIQMDPMGNIGANIGSQLAKAIMNFFGIGKNKDSDVNDSNNTNGENTSTGLEGMDGMLGTFPNGGNGQTEPKPKVTFSDKTSTKEVNGSKYSATKVLNAEGEETWESGAVSEGANHEIGSIYTYTTEDNKEYICYVDEDTDGNKVFYQVRKLPDREDDPNATYLDNMSLKNNDDGSMTVEINGETYGVSKENIYNKDIWRNYAFEYAKKLEKGDVFTYKDIENNIYYLYYTGEWSPPPSGGDPKPVLKLLTNKSSLWQKSENNTPTEEIIAAAKENTTELKGVKFNGNGGGLLPKLDAGIIDDDLAVLWYDNKNYRVKLVAGDKTNDNEAILAGKGYEKGEIYTDGNGNIWISRGPIEDPLKVVAREGVTLYGNDFEKLNNAIKGVKTETVGEKIKGFFNQKAEKEAANAANADNTIDRAYSAEIIKNDIDKGLEKGDWFTVGIYDNQGNEQKFKVKSGGAVVDKNSAIYSKAAEEGIYDGEVFAYGDEAYVMRNGKIYSIDTRLLSPKQEEKMISALAADTTNPSGEGIKPNKESTKFVDANKSYKPGDKFKVQNPVYDQFEVKVDKIVSKDSDAYNAMVNSGEDYTAGESFNYKNSVYVVGKVDSDNGYLYKLVDNEGAKALSNSIAYVTENGTEAKVMADSQNNLITFPEKIDTTDMQGQNLTITSSYNNYGYINDYISNSRQTNTGDKVVTQISVNGIAQNVVLDLLGTFTPESHVYKAAAAKGLNKESGYVFFTCYGRVYIWCGPKERVVGIDQYKNPKNDTEKHSQEMYNALYQYLSELNDAQIYPEDPFE